MKTEKHCCCGRVRCGSPWNLSLPLDGHWGPHFLVGASMAQVVEREVGENGKGRLGCSLVEITSFKCRETLWLVMCFSGRVSVTRRLFKGDTSTVPILNWSFNDFLGL